MGSKLIKVVNDRSRGIHMTLKKEHMTRILSMCSMHKYNNTFLGVHPGSSEPGLKPLLLPGDVPSWIENCPNGKNHKYENGVGVELGCESCYHIPELAEMWKGEAITE